MEHLFFRKIKEEHATTFCLCRALLFLLLFAVSSPFFLNTPLTVLSLETCVLGASLLEEPFGRQRLPECDVSCHPSTPSPSSRRRSASVETSRRLALQQRRHSSHYPENKTRRRRMVCTRRRAYLIGLTNNRRDAFSLLRQPIQDSEGDSKSLLGAGIKLPQGARKADGSFRRSYWLSFTLPAHSVSTINVKSRSTESLSSSALCRTHRLKFSTSATNAFWKSSNVALLSCRRSFSSPRCLQRLTLTEPAAMLEVESPRNAAAVDLTWSSSSANLHCGKRKSQYDQHYSGKHSTPLQQTKSSPPPLCSSIAFPNKTVFTSHPSPYFSCVVTPDSPHCGTASRQRAVSLTSLPEAKSQMTPGELCSSSALSSRGVSTALPSTSSSSSGRERTMIEGIRLSRETQLGYQPTTAESQKTDQAKASSEDELTGLLQVGLEAVYRAYTIAARLQSRLPHAGTQRFYKKADLSPVTLADYSVQCVISMFLRQRENAPTERAKRRMVTQTHSHENVSSLSGASEKPRGFLSAANGDCRSLPPSAIGRSDCEGTLLLAEENVASVPRDVLSAVAEEVSLALPSPTGCWTADDLLRAFHANTCHAAECIQQLYASRQQSSSNTTYPQKTETLSANRTKSKTTGYWVLDPIDGTLGFLRGGQYAIALAYILNGEAVMGILGCPNLPHKLSDSEGRSGSIFFAVKGRGAKFIPMDSHQFDLTQDGSPKACSRLIASADTIRVNRSLARSEMRLFESVEPSHSSQSQTKKVAQELGIHTAPIRLDSQVKYGLLARGEGSLILRLPRNDYCENVWDHAAGVVIIREAGGQVSHADGSDVDFAGKKQLENQTGMVVSCGGQVHTDAVRALQKLRPPILRKGRTTNIATSNSDIPETDVS